MGGCVDELHSDFRLDIWKHVKIHPESTKFRYHGTTDCSVCIMSSNHHSRILLTFPLIFTGDEADYTNSKLKLFLSFVFDFGFCVVCFVTSRNVKKQKNQTSTITILEMVYLHEFNSDLAEK